LQSRQQNDDRWLCAQIDGPHAGSHQRDQLVMDDLDERLARRQALVNLEAHDFAADGLDEGLHHGQCDVRFQQRHAHLAQCVADVLVGQPSAAAQVLDDALQALGQFVEHGKNRVRIGRCLV
jgi:hypothetical protein